MRFCHGLFCMHFKNDLTNNCKFSYCISKSFVILFTCVLVRELNEYCILRNNIKQRRGRETMKLVWKVISNVISFVLFAVMVCLAFVVISSKASGGDPTVMGYQFKSSVFQDRWNQHF